MPFEEGSGTGADGAGRPRARPPWWPEDEPWPPEGSPWRYRRGGWGPWGRRRRAPGFGCLFGILFATVVVIVLGSLVATASGLLELAGPLPLIVVLLAAVIVVALVGRAFARTGRTLDELVEAAHRVESGDYSVRVREPTRGPWALRELVRGFDTMVARLEADERGRRALLADVSHELRTPLAVIAGSVEAIADGVHPPDEAHLGAILEETRVLERLIEDLRTLALSEAGTLTLHREPTDLDVLVADASRSFEAAAEAAGVTIDTAIVDTPIVEIDPIRIRQVVGNLVSNAIRHSPAGGHVTVSVGPADEGSSIEVRVEDDGPGVPTELAGRAFDRFARGPESRGSGLGLPIAKSLVEAHDGRIGLDSGPDRRTAAWFRLPVGSPVGPR
jgi:two-component system, OmpR family, sensor histidine kinase BaeS